MNTTIWSFRKTKVTVSVELSLTQGMILTNDGRSRSSWWKNAWPITTQIPRMLHFFFLSLILPCLQWLWEWPFSAFTLYYRIYIHSGVSFLIGSTRCNFFAVNLCFLQKFVSWPMKEGSQKVSSTAPWRQKSSQCGVSSSGISL